LPSLNSNSQTGIARFFTVGRQVFADHEFPAPPIRKPTPEEYPKNIRQLCIRFPELTRIAADENDLHFLLIHKLQYQRLSSLFASEIPKAAFVWTRVLDGSLQPTIV